MKAKKIQRKKASDEAQAGDDSSNTPITYSKRASEKKVQISERSHEWTARFPCTTKPPTYFVANGSAGRKSAEKSDTGH